MTKRHLSRLQVAKRRWQPASIRLMDNDQFKFALILKPESTYVALVLDSIKKFYITTIKGFDPDHMCVMTLLFEADEADVNINEKNLYNLSKRFGGYPAGEMNGERGYMLTFVIAYIRVSKLPSNYWFFWLQCLGVFGSWWLHSWIFIYSFQCKITFLR